MGPPLLGGPSWAKVGWEIGAVGREAGGYKRQPGIATSAPTLKGVDRACDKRAEELALWGAARLLAALAEGWGDRHRHRAPQLWGPGVPGELRTRWGGGVSYCALSPRGSEGGGVRR